MKIKIPIALVNIIIRLRVRYDNAFFTKGEMVAMKSLLRMTKSERVSCLSPS
ncbi:hypothetical protein EKTHUN627_12110 [Enterobacter kobei]|nr:hypothetical protein EKTHUN627_12110 [Enterobacter kobei]GJA04009.1 hypothetical protein ECV0102_43570 [Enterobacter cloacae]